MREKEAKGRGSLTPPPFPAKGYGVPGKALGYLKINPNVS